MEVQPASEEFAYRIQLFGDDVESIVRFDPLTGARVLLTVFAASVVGGLNSIPGAVAEITAKHVARSSAICTTGRSSTLSLSR